MTAFDDLYAEVKKDIPSCPDAVIKQQAFMTVNDFCQYTNIWQQTVDLNILKDAQSYDINGQVTDGKVNRLLLVYNPASQTYNWPMSGIAMRVPGIITTYRAPGQNATWKAIVAKRPSNMNTEGWPIIDEWIIDKYGDSLAAGTSSRITAIPQKAYTNPMVSKDYLRTYIDGRNLARANDGHANVLDAQNWRFPQTWATRHA